MEAVAVMEAITTTREDGITVLGKAGMVIIEEEEAVGHAEGTSPLTMWARAAVDIICRGASPITTIMYRQVTIMLLFRRSGVPELGACRMASDGLNLEQYGVTKVSGMNACGSYGVEREI